MVVFGKVSGKVLGAELPCAKATPIRLSHVAHTAAINADRFIRVTGEPFILTPPAIPAASPVILGSIAL
jgi:hypothetical protein